MGTTIKFNGNIQGSKRKSKIAFSSDKLILDGPQTFFNENNTPIAEVTFRNGVKDGPSFIFIEGYKNGENAVDLIEYKNNEITRSEVYLIKGDDIYERTTLVRDTFYENGVVTSDVKFNNDILSEKFERNGDNLVNYYYKPNGDFDMCAKIDINKGGSVHVTSSEIEGKYDLVKVSASQAVNFHLRHYKDDNSCTVFSESNYSMIQSPEHTTIQKFGRYEYSYDKSFYENGKLKITNNEIFDGFEETHFYDILSETHFVKTHFVYNIDHYSLLIKDGNISISSYNGPILHPTPLKGFSIGIFRRMRFWYNNFNAELVEEIIRHYKEFTKTEIEIVELYLTEAKSISKMDYVNYEGLID